MDMTADVVVVGGGIAGSAIATVLSRNGLQVVVLERQKVYRDRVRGESIPAWGVAEAQRLGLYDILLEAGAVLTRWRVAYDETRSPAAAEAAARDLSQVVPGVPGWIGVGHPAACHALSRAAEASGAIVLRGAGQTRVMVGNDPSVHYEMDGQEHHVRCALVIGADGRSSTVRQQAGIVLSRAMPTHMIAGLLVDGLAGWPQDTLSIGTDGDVMFLIFPQGGERARLYCCIAPEQRGRFNGTGGAERFLEAFAGMSCLPQAQALARGVPVGPCATFGGEDTWTDVPFSPGLVLIGDAAGYNDPIIGQGLSLALRDVRVLSELLLAGRDWSPQYLQPYADERRERLRRLRFTAALIAALQSEFGPEAAERRRRFFARAAADATLTLALAATGVGPAGVPAWAFEDGMRKKVLQHV